METNTLNHVIDNLLSLLTSKKCLKSEYSYKTNNQSNFIKLSFEIS